MTDQEFEEIKIVHKITPEMLHFPKKLIKWKSDLYYKWLPVDVTGMLIKEIERLMAKDR